MWSEAVMLLFTKTNILDFPVHIKVAYVQDIILFNSFYISIVEKEMS